MEKMILLPYEKYEKLQTRSLRVDQSTKLIDGGGLNAGEKVERQLGPPGTLEKRNVSRGMKRKLTLNERENKTEKGKSETSEKTAVGQTGTNYPYKAYIDTLLSTSANDKVELESQMFIKETAGHDDPNVRGGSNTGLYIRGEYTKEGRILELEGPIHSDIFQQNRLIINGVSLSLRLHQSRTHSV
ncbi:Hypothetical predicted protein [Mytilus galloprovincialis]|uniref:Uncharacterized protein n=1 Tax=Mytilus galloprovincialis TaxID=29158 RepID=A0A8B6H6Y6_MYTGA|nr:Hypothetical predicted protein [Mytilus galloprovincialis]